MNVKVGQWVRFENDIMLITKIEKQDNITWLYVNGGVFSAFGYEMYKNNIKVANDPRELIEVGDLVDDTIMGYLVEVLGVNNDGSLLTNEYNDRQYVYSHKITKILTPNSNGGYDLQWSATVPKEQRTNETE